jgi:hypothetical protein
MACQPGPLHVGWSLRDGYIPPVGAPIGRDRRFSCLPSRGQGEAGIYAVKWADAILGGRFRLPQGFIRLNAFYGS